MYVANFSHAHVVEKFLVQERNEGFVIRFDSEGQPRMYVANFSHAHVVANASICV